MGAGRQQLACDAIVKTRQVLPEAVAGDENGREAGPGQKILGLAKKYTEDERNTLRKVGVNTLVEIDGKALSDGKVGRVATRMREIYLDEMRKAAI